MDIFRVYVYCYKITSQFLPFNWIEFPLTERKCISHNQIHIHIRMIPWVSSDRVTTYCISVFGGSEQQCVRTRAREPKGQKQNVCVMCMCKNEQLFEWAHAQLDSVFRNFESERDKEVAHAFWSLFCWPQRKNCHLTREKTKERIERNNGTYVNHQTRLIQKIIRVIWLYVCRLCTKMGKTKVRTLLLLWK